MQQRNFTDASGVEVTTWWWPVDAPIGIVVVAHGASEHARRYDRFATALNAAGFAVVAPDHRGHGGTIAATGGGQLGAGGAEALLGDLDELRAQAREAFGPVPVLLFGHSMGAMISLAYLAHHAAELAGAVLCGFSISLEGIDDLPAFAAAIAEAEGRATPAASLLGDFNAAFEPVRTPHDWLSRDEAEVDRYLADPLCGDANPLTYGFLADLVALVAEASHHLDAISCPVLVIAGDQDAAAGMGAHATGVAAALSAAGVEVECTLFGGARHELLNETNREEVTAMLLAWLSARAGERS